MPVLLVEVMLPMSLNSRATSICQLQNTISPFNQAGPQGGSESSLYFMNLALECDGNRRQFNRRILCLELAYKF
jgi:hypothetical protein